MKKNNHLFRILTILSLIVAVWSCQTDLVSPQTENRTVSQNQNLSAQTSSNRAATALEEREDDHALFAKIVARRDNPETWDALGNPEHLEYYTQVFNGNPEVQAIFLYDGCGESDEFGGIVGTIGTTEEGSIIKAVPIDGTNIGTGLESKIIKQPDGESPTICFLAWMRERVLLLCPDCG